MTKKIYPRYASITWRLRKSLSSRLGIRLPNKVGLGQKATLVVCFQQGLIPESQAYTLYLWRRMLEETTGLRIAFLPCSLLDSGIPPHEKTELVLFQGRWDWDRAAIESVVARLKNTFPRAKLGYLDWYAPTDLRQADLLNDHIDLYLKKSLLADRNAYGQPTRGDTNLTDFFMRRFGIEEPEQCWEIPDGFLEKVQLFPSFLTAPSILPHFLTKDPPRMLGRPLDLHARISSKGSGWYLSMRREAQEAVDALRGIQTTGSERIPRRKFLSELGQAKLCFSPFGYGEVCWRDYEAFMMGSVLVKPDMSHIEVEPPVFVPNETYIPVAWDLSDFEDKIHAALRDTDHLQRIADNAYKACHDYIAHNVFTTSFNHALVTTKILPLQS